MGGGGLLNFSLQMNVFPHLTQELPFSIQLQEQETLQGNKMLLHSTVDCHWRETQLYSVALHSFREMLFVGSGNMSCWNTLSENTPLVYRDSMGWDCWRLTQAKHFNTFPELAVTTVTNARHCTWLCSSLQCKTKVWLPRLSHV